MDDRESDDDVVFVERSDGDIESDQKSDGDIESDQKSEDMVIVIDHVNDIHQENNPSNNNHSLNRTYSDQPYQQSEELNPFEDDASGMLVNHKEVKSQDYMGVSPTKVVIHASTGRYKIEWLFDNPNHTVELDSSFYE